MHLKYHTTAVELARPQVIHSGLESVREAGEAHPGEQCSLSRQGYVICQDKRWSKRKPYVRVPIMAKPPLCSRVYKITFRGHLNHREDQPNTRIKGEGCASLYADSCNGCLNSMTS
jgi:hypothetical protein